MKEYVTKGLKKPLTKKDVENLKKLLGKEALFILLSSGVIEEKKLKEESEKPQKENLINFLNIEDINEETEDKIDLLNKRIECLTEIVETLLDLQDNTSEILQKLNDRISALSKELEEKLLWYHLHLLPKIHIPIMQHGTLNGK